MKRSNNGRNFGYRCSMEKAGKRALIADYGGGHYNTVKTHTDKWAVFCEFCRSQDIRSFLGVDCQRLLERYGEWVFCKVENEDCSISYAHGLISSANRVFSALRGDDVVFISPTGYVGPRSYIRTTAPASMNIDDVRKLFDDLLVENLERAAAAFSLCRTLGMRREEAAKADLNRLSKERSKGFVQIKDGTKGGRKADRPVPVGDDQNRAIDYAMSVRPEGSRNLIAPDESYAAFATARHSCLNLARAVMHHHGVKGFHDARAAYACVRYLDETGSVPPVLGGVRPSDREMENEACRVIAKELGHRRTDVLVSYYGSWGHAK